MGNVAATIRAATADDRERFWPLLEVMGKTDDRALAHERFDRLVDADDHCVVVAAEQGALIGGFAPPPQDSSAHRSGVGELP